MIFLFSLVLQAQLGLSSLNTLIQNTLKKDSHFDITASVRDCASGKEIYTYHSKESMVPASTFKLLSTGLFLEKFGPRYMFKTEYFIDGKIIGNSLNGNLIIKSNGDPSYKSEKFEKNNFSDIDSIFNYLGIKKIKGRILVDQDTMTSVPLNWLAADIGNYYAALPRRFNYNQNMYSLAFNTQKAEGEKAQLLQSGSYNEVLNLVRVGALGTGDEAHILQYPFSDEVRIVGTLPPNKESFTIKGVLSKPELAFTKDLTKHLAEHGIQCENAILDAGPTLNTIGSVNSPSSLELVKLCNFESDNFIAEALAKHLGDNYNDYVKRNFEEKEIENKYMIISDGSGLSPVNSISAFTMTDYLHKMSKSAEFSFFKSTIPTLGKDGTVASLDPRNLSKGKLQAKSGTLATTKNYAGYYSGKKLYAFSFNINGLGEDESKKARQFLESMMLQLLKVL